MNTVRLSTIKEFHFVNIDPEITNLIVEDIEMNLIQNLMVPTKSELITSNQNNNNNEITYYRDNQTYINCQSCKQRTRSWLQISPCNHKYINTN